MSQYNLIASTDEVTVYAEYTPEYRLVANYRSEAAAFKYHKDKLLRFEGVGA